LAIVDLAPLRYCAPSITTMFDFDAFCRIRFAGAYSCDSIHAFA
jgi:hypothetical protein